MTSSSSQISSFPMHRLLKLGVCVCVWLGFVHLNNRYFVHCKSRQWAERQVQMQIRKGKSLSMSKVSDPPKYTHKKFHAHMKNRTHWIGLDQRATAQPPQAQLGKYIKHLAVRGHHTQPKHEEYGKSPTHQVLKHSWKRLPSNYRDSTHSTS